MQLFKQKPEVLIEGQIYYTEDLAQFKLIGANRLIDPKHVDRLKRRIAEKNLLAQYPILVDRDWQVKDGQHRLQAAKELELGIYYIIDESSDIEDIAKAAGATKSWELESYLHHYVSLGLSAYIELEEFCKKYPIIPLYTAVSIGYRKGQRSRVAGAAQEAREAFKNGEFLFANKETLYELVRYLLDFQQYFPDSGARSFVGAVARLVKARDYDHERMKRKLEFGSHLLTKQATTAQYLKILEDIYNYKAQEASYVRLSKYGTNRKEL